MTIIPFRTAPAAAASRQVSNPGRGCISNASTRTKINSPSDNGMSTLETDEVGLAHLDVSDLISDVRVDVAYRLSPPPPGMILFGLLLSGRTEITTAPASLYWSMTRSDADLLAAVATKALPLLYPDSLSPRAAVRADLLHGLTATFEDRIDGADVLACLGTWLLSTSSGADTLRGKRCVGIVAGQDNDQWTVRLVGGNDPGILQQNILSV